MELIIVIAIIVILATLSFTYLKPAERLESARQGERAVVKRELKNALKQYALDPEHQSAVFDNLVSEKFLPICRYGVPPPLDNNEEPLCVSLDPLVEEGLLAEIPEDKLIAEDPAFTGYEARMDCVGNMYVSFPDDPAKPSTYIPVDVNGDGEITIEDYDWDERNADHNGDGKINWEDHLEWAKTFKPYCRSCTCEQSRKIDIVYVMDTSNSFKQEWPSLPGHVEEIKRVFSELEYDLKTTRYALPGPNLPFTLIRSPQPGSHFDEWAAFTSCPECSKDFWANAEKCPNCTSDNYSQFGEAWGLGTRWILENHIWRGSATRIIFIIGDHAPHGGQHKFNVTIPGDEYIVADINELAEDKNVSLFALHSDWEVPMVARECRENGELCPDAMLPCSLPQCAVWCTGNPPSCYNDAYGDPSTHDFEELMRLATSRACGQALSYSYGSSESINLMYEAIFSYLVEACYINCGCQN